MASTVTTFAVFQTLLQRSIDLDPNLDTATKASLKTRAANLARQQDIVLDQSKLLSTSGQATEDIPNGAINVGTPGVSGVEFDPMTFVIPLRVDGTKGVRGFLPGHVGTSANPLVDTTDITLKYRLASGDQYQKFDRTTVLDEVTWIQFAVDIVDPGILSALPALHVHAEQV